LVHQVIDWRYVEIPIDTKKPYQMAGLFIHQQSGQLRLIKRCGHFNNRFLTVAIHH
jgi:hypothetical protein